jgi:hypothetical protein
MPAVVGTNVTTGACELRNGSLVGVSVDNSGIASATTATAGTNTTQLATTANVYASSLGWGQTWQDVTGSRAAGTTYTNSTGKPIFVSVSQQCSSVEYYHLEILDGTWKAIAIAGNATGSVEVLTQVTGIILNGQSYRITNNGSVSIQKWWELR